MAVKKKCLAGVYVRPRSQRPKRRRACLPLCVSPPLTHQVLYRQDEAAEAGLCRSIVCDPWRGHGGPKSADEQTRAIRERYGLHHLRFDGSFSSRRNPYHLDLLNLLENPYLPHQVDLLALFDDRRGSTPLYHRFFHRQRHALV